MFSDMIKICVQRPDVKALTATFEASPVLAALGLLAVSVSAAKFMRRLIPMTRRSASRLSFRYRRALRSGKLPRGLKFRRHQ